MLPRRSVLPALLAALLSFVTPLSADNHVMVVALAEQDYTRAKFDDGKSKAESYVVMPGNFFGGSTVDRTLERMPFRKIAGLLAYELAKREYWPAQDPNQADLLMVIHWGVTSPRATTHEMTGRTSLSTDVSTSHESLNASLMAVEEEQSNAAAVQWDVGERSSINTLYAEDVLRQQGDQAAAEADQQDSARLLGLVKSLRRAQQAFVPTVNDIAVQHSLKEERYFIIVQAYDLRRWEKGKVNQSVWTIRLNIGSPGKNFEEALVRMSRAGVNWFGRTTDDLVMVRTKEFKGEVEMPPIVILGEEKK